MRTVQAWTCELGYGADTMFHRTHFMFLYSSSEIIFILYIVLVFKIFSVLVLVSVLVIKISLVGYLSISTNVSCYQSRCRRQYCLRFSNTSHAWTSAWCAHRSTAAAQTPNFISHELWPQQARAELSWLQDLGSLQQREYELEVNKLEEIKQQLAELWISRNNNIWVKRCDFSVSVFCQVVEKHELGEVKN